MAGPMYRQIADDLRRKIDAGEYEPGSQLPTEDELMEQYATSRNTVRGALKELATLRLVDTQHGKGTFVLEPVKPIVTTLTSDPTTGRGGGEGIVYTAEVARSGRRATTTDTAVRLEQANPSVADSLRVPEGSEVVSRQELRYVDDLPWSIQTSYYPTSLVAQAPLLSRAGGIDGGTVGYLAECGIEQAGYVDGIEVRAPEESEIAFFDLPPDGRVQVVEIYRVAFDQRQERVRLTITVYRADRNRFVINVGEVPKKEGLLPAAPEVAVSSLLGSLNAGAASS
jgi:GntR family transcriptional regulator